MRQGLNNKGYFVRIPAAELAKACTSPPPKEYKTYLYRPLIRSRYKIMVYCSFTAFLKYI